MNDDSGGITCAISCWLIALFGGILIAVMLMIAGSFSFIAACFFGAIAFLLGGLMLSWAFCRGLPAPGEAQIEPGHTGQVGQIKPSTVSGTAAARVPAAAAAAGGVAAAATASAATPDAVAAKSSTAGDQAKADATVKDDPAPMESTANRSRVAASTTKPQEPAKPKAEVKPSARLAGQDDLAGRKGEWKYDGKDGDAKAEPVKADPAKTEKPAPKAAAKKDVVDADAGTKPQLLSKARDGGPDDLKQIKGVGVQMEAMLHEMGVFHFDQIAAWDKSEVEWVDANLPRFKGRVTRDEWVKQASLLASGGETEFSKKVQKGGVYDGK